MTAALRGRRREPRKQTNSSLAELRRVEGIVPAARDPGLQADAERQPKAEPVVYEYAVSAVDGVGESDKSKTANTDPTSWRNWYPDTQLQFKRRSAYWLPPYVKPEQVPPATYPE